MRDSTESKNGSPSPRGKPAPRHSTRPPTESFRRRRRSTARSMSVDPPTSRRPGLERAAKELPGHVPAATRARVRRPEKGPPPRGSLNPPNLMRATSRHVRAGDVPKGLVIPGAGVLILEEDQEGAPVVRPARTPLRIAGRPARGAASFPSAGFRLRCPRRRSPAERAGRPDSRRSRPPRNRRGIRRRARPGRQTERVHVISPPRDLRSSKNPG